MSYVCHDDEMLRRFDDYNPFLTQVLYDSAFNPGIATADRWSTYMEEVCATYVSP